MPAPDIRSIFDLTGRVALITGGSRGLGLSMARGFAAAGAKVVLSSRKADACAEAAAIVNDEGGDALAAPCHMGDVAQIRALVETVDAHHGRLDIVVNNAANPLKQGLDDLTEDGWDKSQGVNIRGPVFLAQAALPHLRRSANGSIINVLSVAAFSGAPQQLSYGAAKAALLNLTKSTARALAADGIRVNAIAPGPFSTYMVTSGTDEFQHAAASGTLQKRLADPDEIIGAALLLASDAGSFITGTCITVDGGMTC
jgi:NAD(P)-dependent dehydrogenase (short-subunit alcohol dehydrogenase family)